MVPVFFLFFFRTQGNDREIDRKEASSTTDPSMKKSCEGILTADE